MSSITGIHTNKGSYRQLEKSRKLGIFYVFYFFLFSKYLNIGGDFNQHVLGPQNIDVFIIFKITKTIIKDDQQKFNSLHKQMGKLIKILRFSCFPVFLQTENEKLLLLKIS